MSQLRIGQFLKYLVVIILTVLTVAMLTVMLRGDGAEADIVVKKELEDPVVAMNNPYQNQQRNENAQVVQQVQPHNLAKKPWEKLKILCYVVTSAREVKRHKAIRDTWAPRCDKFYLMSHFDDDNLKLIGIYNKKKGSAIDADLILHGLDKVYKENPGYDWYLHTDDLTYVIMENLKYFLYDVSSTSPVFITANSLLHPVLGKDKKPNGFMVNAPGAALFHKWNWYSLCLPWLSNPIEAISKCMLLLHVTEEDQKIPGVADGTYYSYDLGPNLKGENHRDWPPKPDQSKMSDLYPVMYHNIQDRKFYTLEFLLYQARVFNEKPNESAEQT